MPGHLFKISVFLILASFPRLFAESLFEAVRSGDTAAAAKVLKAGKNPNEIEMLGTDEKTPLMAAADQMDPKMAALLLGQKNTVNFRTPLEGKTALMYTCGLGESYGEHIIEIINLLLKSGAKVDDQDKQKRSAVFYAVESAWPLSLQAILKAKPKLDLRDKSGHTPLSLATEKGYTALVLNLLEAGANPNLGKKEEKSELAPLHIAIQNGNAEAARILIGHKADVNLKTYSLGRTESPLHLATAKADIETMRALVKAGADVNAVNEMTYTPLIEACQAGEAEAVRVLIELGADVNKKDSGGHSPLLYAMSGGGKQEIIAMLKKAGAKR